MNKVTLQGYLGKDFELSIFNGSNGNDSYKVASDLAVSESKWNPQTNTYDETTTWYRIESGRSSVVKNAVFFRKGMAVQVIGDLSMITYSKRDQATNVSYDVQIPLVKVQEIVAIMVDPAMAYWFHTNYKGSFNSDIRTQWVTIANSQGMAQKDFRQNRAMPQAQQAFVQNNMQQGFATQAPQGFTPPATGFAQAMSTSPVANYGGQAPASTSGFGGGTPIGFAPPNANNFKAPAGPAQIPTVANGKPHSNGFASGGFGNARPQPAQATTVASSTTTGFGNSNPTGTTSGTTFNSFAGTNKTATNVAPASNTVATK